MKRYLFSNGGQNHGPYTLDEITNAHNAAFINDTTWIWVEGSSESSARDLNEFLSEINQSPPPLDQFAEHAKPKTDLPELAGHEPPPISDEILALENYKHNNSSDQFGTGPVNHLLNIYKKSFTLEGRASRSEYWGFLLFCLLLIIMMSGISTIVTAALLIISIPTMFSLQVRRLHDLGWSGWWALLYLLGPWTVILLLASAFEGTAGPNKYDRGVRQRKEKIEPDVSWID
jgi:uncharacterized membrane protein YhaH (DUF805 family)